MQINCNHGQPENLLNEELLAHPLWMSASGLLHTISPTDNAANISLANLCPSDILEMWTYPNSLLPSGGNLPISFGMAMNDLFCTKPSIQHT